MTRRWLALFFVAAGMVVPARADGPSPADLEFFEKKVRPILVERCYECHSAGARKLRGNLLLDTKAGWVKGGDTGPAVEPGQVEESLLVQAIRYDDPAMQMPPKGKLPAEMIATLEEWVRRGAPDPRNGPATAPAKSKTIDIEAGRKHWAFRPLARVEPPAVKDEGWCRSPIDRFLLAKLEEKDLRPAEPVTRRQFIRRVSFDLVGLPPSPEEVEAFVNDPAPDAYERLVDRLLDSPHHGERWARHWLDLARFAESHGFEHDYDRPTAYPYRDFVIEALNADLPYDKFVAWQLAGDELAPDDPLAQKATGFLAAGVHSTQITANQVEKERYDELDDMTNTTGTAMLGLSIGCARCHDHKFDPIPTADYYRLLATFTTVVRTEVDLNLDPAGYEKARRTYERAHSPYVAALARYEAKELAGSLERWERSRQAGSQSQATDWVVLDRLEARSTGGATFKPMDDGSWKVEGKNADFDVYTLSARTDLKGIKAVRLEALADPSLPQGGPGRAGNGNFALTDFRIQAAPANDARVAIQPPLSNPRATFEQAGLPIRATVDGDEKSGWAVDPQFGKDQAAVFDLGDDLGFERGTTLTFTLAFKNNAGHNLGRLRLSVTTSPGPASLEGQGVPLSIASVLATPRESRSREQAAAILAWYKTIDPEWRALKAAEQNHARLAPKPPVVKAMISSEGLPAVRLHTQGADFLEKTHFLRRGDPNQKQGEAAQGFLQVLMSAPDAERHWQLAPPAGWRTSYRRASLARWMTDTDRGAGALLARVIVNRLWQHHFGKGIVATPSDFGTQGAKPSHPELLDWLALELIRNGWHLKPIHKLMVTSAAYREGSEADAALRRGDPDNLLFGRRERHRLEAEAIRDAMLSVSGLLDPTMYGPGTLDEHQRRRSIYFTVKRSKLIPMMTLFDAPDGLTPIAVRSSTTVAPQSLMLMNSPIVRDWAGGFARRIAPQADTPPERAVRDAYQIALNRPPTAAELREELAFLSRQARSYEAAGRADGQTLALTDFCQVLMSLNEFIFVE